MVVVHVLGDRHKHAFVALHAVAGLNLGGCKNRDDDGKDYHQDRNALFGENPFNPFPKVLVQGGEQDDSRNELHDKQGQR